MSHIEDQGVRWLTTKEKVLYPVSGVLLVALWNQWLKTALYDEHLKHIPIDALWIIITLLLIGIWVLIITIRQKNQTLKKQTSDFSIKLKETTSELKKSLDKYENKETTMSKYTIDKQFGYFIHKTNNKHVCPKCLQLTPPQQNEIVEDNNRADCNSCDWNRIKELPPIGDWV